MAKEQRTFTKEFKQEAVRLAETSRKPITEIARDLGVSDSTIHNWRKQLALHGEQAFPGSGHQTAQEEELRRLKRELEIVKQERDILKPSGQYSHPTGDDRIEGKAEAAAKSRKEKHMRTAKHYLHLTTRIFRPEQVHCLDCHARLRRAHIVSRRTVVTLTEVIRLTHWGYRCPNPVRGLDPEKWGG
jgi:transposase